jgi:predicted ATPase
MDGWVGYLELLTRLQKIQQGKVEVLNCTSSPVLIAYIA